MSISIFDLLKRKKSAEEEAAEKSKRKLKQAARIRRLMNERRLTQGEEACNVFDTFLHDFRDEIPSR